MPIFKVLKNIYADNLSKSLEIIYFTTIEISDGEKTENGGENIVTNKIRGLKFCDISKTSCPSVSFMYLISNCSDPICSLVPNFNMNKCVD